MAAQQETVLLPATVMTQRCGRLKAGSSGKLFHGFYNLIGDIQIMIYILNIFIIFKFLNDL